MQLPLFYMGFMGDVSSQPGAHGTVLSTCSLELSWTNVVRLLVGKAKQSPKRAFLLMNLLVYLSSSSKERFFFF